MHVAPRLIVVNGLRFRDRRLIGQAGISQHRSRRQHGQATRIGEEASAFGDRVTGAIKDKTGELVDDPSLERRGEEQNARGRERQETNQVIGGPERRYVAGFYEIPSPPGAPTSACAPAITRPTPSTS